MIFKTKQELEAIKKEMSNNKANLEKVTRENLDLQTKNLELNLNLAKQQEMQYYNQGLPNNPTFNFNVENQQILSGQYQNYINKLSAREAQMGEGENGFLIYLLILERARYFKNRVLIKDAPFYLEKIIYEAMYYGAINGKSGVYFKNDLPTLVQPSNLSYNIYGELVSADITYINYQNSVKWNYDSETLKGEKLNKLCIFKANDEEFGLWVLAWFYLKKVTEYFEILDTQTKFLNLKYLVENGSGKAGIEAGAYVKLLTKGDPVLLVNDMSKIKALEKADVDINGIFELIINFITWFDNHILGIRTKDVDPSDKAREIVANSGINSKLQSKQEQNLNYFIEDFLNQINTVSGLNIKWVDANITLDQTLTADTKTDQKISNGKEDGKDEI